MTQIRTIDRLRGLGSIVRAVDGFVIGIGMIVGMILAGSVQLNIPFHIYLLVISGGFFISSHAMVINDIIDLEIDKINEPKRALPSGLLSKKQALLFAVILAGVGILSFGLVDLSGYVKTPLTWLYALFHVGLADLYNFKLKQTGLAGNITVAWMSYAMFLFADLFIVGSFTLLPQVVGGVFFTASLSREIIKGIMDIEGDSEHGIKTIAVRLGPKAAKFLAMSILSICPVLITIVIFKVGLIGKIGATAVLLLYIYIIVLTYFAENKKTARKVKHLIIYSALIISPFLILDNLLQI